MQRVIHRHEADLLLPSHTSRPRLLAALAMQESGGGRNWQPNFEPAFWEGGAYWGPNLQALRDKWWSKADPEMSYWCGKAVACSWGPWQILYVTAQELGYAGPPWGLTDPDTCLHWAIALINRRILKKIRGQLSETDTVRWVADGYNSGNPRDSNIPKHYINSILEHYENPNILASLDIIQDQ